MLLAVITTVAASRPVSISGQERWDGYSVIQSLPLKSLGDMDEPLLSCKMEKIPPSLLHRVMVKMQIKDGVEVGSG